VRREVGGGSAEGGATVEASAERRGERRGRQRSSCSVAIVLACAVALAPNAARAQDVGPSPAQAEPPPLEGGAPEAEAPPAAAASVGQPVAPPPDEAPTVEPEPAAEDVPPPVDEVGEPPEAADSDAVFRAFRVYAASERDKRLVGAVAGVAAGVTTMVLGATIAEPTGTDPEVWYVVGGITAGVSLLGLLLPSPAEAMARSFRVKEPGHTPTEARALEIRWNDYALAAKRRRVTGGAVSLVVSAVAIGGGIAIATGAGDFTDNDRYFWSTFLIATGAGLGVGGVASLFVKSPAERSYEAYRAVRPETARLSPLLLGGPGGFLVGARGFF